jgi:hypothetical protein
LKTIAALLAAVPLFAAAQAAPPAQTWTTDPAAQPPPAPAAKPAPPPAQPPPAYAPPPQAAQPAPAPAQYQPPPYPPQYQAPPQGQPPQYQPPPYPPQYPPPQYAQPKRGPQRDSWYIGFGFGSGGGSLATDVRTGSMEDWLGSSPTTFGMNFKVGATLTPKFLLGLDINALSSGVSTGGVTRSIGVSNVDVMATLFPWERGFFLKGGFGRSAMSLSYDDGYGTSSGSASGWNLAGGLGYAWWIGKQFNLTANLDFSRQWYGDSDFTFVDSIGNDLGSPTDSQMWSLSLGFDWF